MANPIDSMKYLIQALRTPAAPASTHFSTGPRAGTSVSSSNPSLGPIEQRRDGYRQYLNEFHGGSQEGDPMSYEDWISKEQ